MRAWDKLVSGSTLTVGTAWDHLNAQGSSGGGVVYVESMDANLVEIQLSGSMSEEVLSTEMTDIVLSGSFFEQALETNFQTETLDAELSDLALSGSIISMNLSANIVEGP